MFGVRPSFSDFRQQVVAAAGAAIGTTAGKWSVMHLGFTLGLAVPFPDGADGLSTAQKAMMLGLYSEYAYA